MRIPDAAPATRIRTAMSHMEAPANTAGGSADTPEASREVNRQASPEASGEASRAVHGAPGPARPAPGTARPLILTLGLDEQSQQQFEQERRLHFPSRLNRIPAHVSLFHALPGDAVEEIKTILAGEAARAPFSVEVHDLMRLGRGVAYALRAPELSGLHNALRARWLPWLSRQDQQPFRAHVVIQNKVDPAAARALYDRLSAQFRPWTATAASLLLWHYDGGPWIPAGVFPFAGRASQPARPGA